MSNGWNEFLQRQGARYGDGKLRDFGDPQAEAGAARDGTVLVDLSHYSLVRATGADAKTFLNGQLTNDIGLLDDTHSQLSAWCSAKGRMLVVLRILRHADGYLLQLPAVLRDDIFKRLRMYVLRSKVVLEIADETCVRLGIAGPAAPAAVRAATGAAPDDESGVARTDKFIVLRLPGAHPRFEILAAPADAPALWSALKQTATPAGVDVWTWHDIMAGLPVVLPETADMFVPQMTNLELLGGVSFNKGCYTGQEIVARVHYLGRLKQRMYRAHVEAAETPQPGTAVYASDRPDQSVGNVVIATPSPSSGHDLLAVIQTSNVESTELHLGQADGPRLTIEPLPYKVT